MFEMNFIGTHSVFSKDDRQKLVFKHIIITLSVTGM